MTAQAFVTRLGLGAASLALAGVVWLGFRSADAPDVAGTTGGGSTSGTSGTSGTSRSTASTGTTGSSGASSAPGSTSSGSSGSSGSKVVDGPTIETFYGPVAVEVTVANGKVTSVTATQLPSGGRSGSISRYAGPILSKEAMAAQSASIDIVSGATYTSRGYAESLQAALDQAGL